MTACENKAFHWLAALTNKSYLIYRKLLLPFFDTSAFRSKLRQVVTYVKSFNEYLASLKSRSNIELKAQLFQ